MKHSKSLEYEDIVKLLIDNCARVNVKTTKDERTPLHLAAINGSPSTSWASQKYEFQYGFNK